MEPETIINCHSCGRVVIRDVRGGDPMFCDVKIINHGAGSLRTAGDPHQCRRLNGMRPDRDYTRRFVEEMCFASAERQTRLAIVEREYKLWALENSGVPMPIRQLVSNLEDRHGVRRSAADQEVLVGIAIRGFRLEKSNEQEQEMSRSKRRRPPSMPTEGTYVPSFEEIDFDPNLELLPGDFHRPYKYFETVERLKDVPRQWRVVIRALPDRSQAIGYKRNLDTGKIKRPAGNFEFKAIVHPEGGDFCIVGRFMGGES